LNIKYFVNINMKTQEDLLKTYTLGDPLGNISELGSDAWSGTVYVGDGIADATVATGEAIGDAAVTTGEVVGDAVVATGDAIVDTADVVGEAIYDGGVATGDAIYDGGVATGEAIGEGVEVVEDTAYDVKEYIIRSIADWANAEMDKIEPSPAEPTLTANEQITEHMF
jgi:hypothetical protein